MNDRKSRRHRFWAGRCNVSHGDAEMVGDQAYSTPGFGEVVHGGVRREWISSFGGY